MHHEPASWPSYLLPKQDSLLLEYFPKISPYNLPDRPVMMTDEGRIITSAYLLPFLLRGANVSPLNSQRFKINALSEMRFVVCHFDIHLSLHSTIDLEFVDETQNLFAETASFPSHPV